MITSFALQLLAPPTLEKAAKGGSFDRKVGSLISPSAHHYSDGERLDLVVLKTSVEI